MAAKKKAARKSTTSSKPAKAKKPSKPSKARKPAKPKGRRGRRGGKLVGQKGRPAGINVMVSGIQIQDLTGNPGATVARYSAYGPGLLPQEIDKTVPTGSHGKSVTFASPLSYGSVVVSVSNPLCTPMGFQLSTSGQMDGPPNTYNILQLTLTPLNLTGMWLEGSP